MGHPLLEELGEGRQAYSTPGAPVRTTSALRGRSATSSVSPGSRPIRWYRATVSPEGPNVPVQRSRSHAASVSGPAAPSGDRSA
ncbi:hypothetical protein AB0O69_12865 [Streptomyces xiamenensis]|uniref:hypothetical protein n=1 Tax=Streptomyces xiamenensis TaxID=408015 RepID=UPI0034351855